MITRERKDKHGLPIPIPSTLCDVDADRLRNDLIQKNSWINKTKYQNQFKHPDTKDALDLMSTTCVYCQQKLTIATSEEDGRSVEHYRNKSDYWWLAYSWDNLFPVCIACNTAKGNDFECTGTKITVLRTTPNDLANIHNLATDYNTIEQPKLLYPEEPNVERHFKYELNGKIDNNDSERGRYTIVTCKLFRTDLQSKRKSIFDTFEEGISLILFDGSKTISEKQNEILKRYFDFQKDAKEDDTTFAGFKRYIDKFFLRELIRAYLSLL